MSDSNPKRKVNVVITGGPGTGKSTIAKLLGELLRYHGFEFSIEEPAHSTPVGFVKTRTIDHLSEITKVEISTMDTLPEKYRPKKRSPREEADEQISKGLRLQSPKLK